MPRQPNHDDVMLAWAIANQGRPRSREEVGQAALAYADAGDAGGEPLDPLVSAALEAHMTQRKARMEDALRRRREQEAFDREKAARATAFDRELQARRDLAGEERTAHQRDRETTTQDERRYTEQQRDEQRQYAEKQKGQEREQEVGDYRTRRGDQWNDSMREQAVRYAERHGDYGPFAKLEGLPELAPRGPTVQPHHVQAIRDVVVHPARKPMTTLDEVQAAGGTPEDQVKRDARRDTIIQGMLAEGVSPREVAGAVVSAYGMGDTRGVREQANRWAQRAAEILSQSK